MGDEYSVPESVLRDASKRNYKSVTIEELQGIYDTVKQIEHFAALKNKLLASQKKRDRDEARTELTGAIVEHFAHRGRLPLTDAGLSMKDKVSRFAQKFDASLLKIEQVVEWMDGGPTGPWHDYFWNPAVDAQAAENDHTKAITAKIAQAVMTIPKSIRARMLEPIELPGIEALVVRRDLLGVALNVGNESNYTKLLKGQGWTAEQVQAMVDKLSAEEIEFVNHIHATLESLWPEIAALQKRLTGIPPPKIEARPFPAANGTIAGGYYPVMYSAVLSSQGGLQLASSVGSLLEPSYVRATTPSGYRKERVEAFSAPFDLDVDRLTSHIAGVVKDLTHRLWLLDANWIVNDRQIRAVIREHMGDAWPVRLADWVGQVANDRNGPSAASLDVWQKSMQHFRFNMVIVSMGFKASTLLSQLAGVAPAIEVIGGKDGDGARWFAVGVARTLQRPRQSYEFMTALSGEMRHRIQTRDRDIQDKLRALEGRNDTFAQVQEFSLKAIGYMELMISLPSWIGAYEKAIASGKSEDTAIRMGDRAVRLGQGAGGAKDLAAVATRSSDMLRLMTMFYTPFSALYGRLRSIGHDVEGVGDLPNTMMRLVWTVVVASTIGELASGHLPDKDKDEEWLTWWLKNMAIYPFLSVPGVRDIASSVTSSYGYQFTPLAQVAKTTTDLLSTARKTAAGEKDLIDLAEKAAKAFSYLVGLPTGQLLITGQYLHDLATHKAQPDNIFQFAHDLLYARPKEK